jgi:hypothetical protein
VDFDPAKLTLVIAGSMGLGALALLAARGTIQRLMLFSMLAGLFFYSGVGTAYREVHASFVGFYFAFVLAMVLGFHLGRVVFLDLSVTVGRAITPVLGRMDRGIFWKVLIAAYIFLSIFPLLWPEPRLQQLIVPPAPDLIKMLSGRFQEEFDPFSVMVGYLRLLLTPLFFVALYRLRRKLPSIALIFLFLLYVRYVENAYLGRGAVVMHMAILFLAVWFLRPSHRGRVAVVVALLAPLLLYGFYMYALLRIGDVVGDISFIEALKVILDTELGFVRDVGTVILASGARVDLMQYFTWIVTLPVPKILTGAIEGARVNYEISELVLGVPTGGYGWYVVLPGVVAESIYIFGTRFFWLHGVFLGFIASFFTRLAERVPQFVFLYFYLVVMFGYVLNRGGVAALLPPLINEFLLFYILVVSSVVVSQRVRRQRAESSIGTAATGSSAM